MIKYVKKTGAVILMVVLCFLLAACSGSKGRKADESAEQAVKNYLEAVKKQDQKTVAQYLEGGDSFSASTEAYEEMPELYDKILDFDYKILSSEEQEGHAVVRVEVTTYDFGTFFSGMFQEMFAKAFETMFSETSEAEMDAMMKEYADNNMSLLKSKNITSEAEIELVKYEDGWKIKDATSMANAILGGVVDSLSDMFGGLVD